MLRLVAGYWCTGEEQHHERARQVIAVGIERQERFNGHFNTRGVFVMKLDAEKAGK